MLESVLLHQSVSVMQRRVALAAKISLVLTALCIPVSITGTDVFITLAAVLGLFSGQLSTRLPRAFSNPVVIWGLMLFLVAVLGMLWSQAEWHQRLSAVHKYGKLLYVPFILPLLVERPWRRRCVNAFLFAMLVTVVISYLKAIGWSHYGKNPVSDWVFHSHIETGFFVAFACYIFALRAVQSSAFRWVNIGMLILFTGQEFFINTGRTGMIAYLVLVMLGFVQMFGWKGVLLGLSIAAMLMFGVYKLSPSFHKNVHRSVASVHQYQKHDDKTSIGWRLSFAKFSLEHIKKKPILGYGAGSFLPEFQQSGGLKGWGDVLHTPDNEFLLFAFEFGVFGLLVLIGYFLRQWLLTFHLKHEKWLAQALVASFAISCLYNAFLYTAVMGYFYIFFVALVFAEYKKLRF